MCLRKYISKRLDRSSFLSLSRSVIYSLLTVYVPFSRRYFLNDGHADSRCIAKCIGRYAYTLARLESARIGFAVANSGVTTLLLLASMIELSSLHKRRCGRYCPGRSNNPGKHSGEYWRTVAFEYKSHYFDSSKRKAILSPRGRNELRETLLLNRERNWDFIERPWWRSNNALARSRRWTY